MKKNHLLQVLETVEKPTQQLRFQDGTTLLVLPYGGRILGLFSKASAENFYWTHPALDSVESARDFYASTDWHNSGGDRTWLSPEVDVFLPDFPKTERYFQPRQLDPGNYRVQQLKNSVRLVNCFALTLRRSRSKVRLEITKEFAPAPNPLRNELSLRNEALAYAGYTQHTSLAVLKGSDRSTGPVGLWNLIQLPHGGDLLIPTFGRSKPKIVLGKISSKDLIIGDQMIRYRMRAGGEHKLSIRAVSCTGRAAYVYPRSERQWDLAIRNFSINPSGEYVDVPWDNPGNQGYAIQACNVNGTLGSFSELEYHVPAIGPGTGRASCLDTSQVWAFRGTPSSLGKVMEILLGSGNSALTSERIDHDIEIDCPHTG